MFSFTPKTVFSLLFSVLMETWLDYNKELESISFFVCKFTLSMSKKKETTKDGLVGSERVVRIILATVSMFTIFTLVKFFLGFTFWISMTL